MRRTRKILLLSLAVLVLAASAYVGYVFLDYHRIGNQTVAVSGEGETAAVETEYELISYNMGFAAYTPDFGFFMDGGTESRAASEESVRKVTGEIAHWLEEQHPDFLMVQEVDTDATRSYHVDEDSLLRFELDPSSQKYTFTFAQNYDSPYLFYPILEPHGKSDSGMLTASRFAVTESLRKELPVESGVYKLLDLDRCYAVNRVPVDNGRELVLYTVHLSAYTSDGTIATEQLRLLIEDMQSEAKKGNYVVCGGDFNKDLLGGRSTSAAAEGLTWARPFPMELLQESGISLVEYENETVPTCRNADGPYHKGQMVVTVDGFLVSDNVTVTEAEVLDTGFSWSDHNPVELHFVLEK